MSIHEVILEEKLSIGLSKAYQLMVVEKIIDWFRVKRVREGFNDLARIRVGYEYRFLHNLLKEIIDPIIMDYTSLFMKLDLKKYYESIRNIDYSNLEIVPAVSIM